jgi:hypothetical protein
LAKGNRDEAAAAHDPVARIVQGRTSMVTLSRRGRSDNWTAALVLRHPLARSVGFECFKGWRPILGRLLERLEGVIAQQPVEARDDFRILQIKQKFGRLRVHLSKAATPEMRAAIDEAEAEVNCHLRGVLVARPDRRPKRLDVGEVYRPRELVAAGRSLLGPRWDRRPGAVSRSPRPVGHLAVSPW